jgi:hypothetical protein
MLILMRITCHPVGSRIFLVRVSLAHPSLAHTVSQNHDDKRDDKTRLSAVLRTPQRRKAHLMSGDCWSSDLLLDGSSVPRVR